MTQLDGKDIFEDLKGQTLSRIDQSLDRLVFITRDGKEYIMHHNQDCCEVVQIEDICGDLDDLIGQPITLAEETTNSENELPNSDSWFMWTFYNIATSKGHVTIRWYGSSNGYYSVNVDFWRSV
jgi:hypothetical protein